ncbi:MAG: hypothetical protein COW88_02890 [Candidatus Lloydbacteria bacterium CG22_combo_CG10-13_8_21_14_all_47_15]|uniref:Gamma-glutamylcyclotransferase n=1 Tax=Candidatus Lloydbacteria bacterium CG22_combo_CG10-13_8_21_14_all_47_15 TaxID=1974635 RepID=A0A2H0CT78_9BACT|nr:MAG: hypothetical protein COW88_02890 [Candidatus Lloydbacteria bacterium CG22_combo_CG10-13_8_21_14_all_47_15]
MLLYFAYGSNMNHAQMVERCPGAKFLFCARLGEYKFQYDGHSKKRGGPVANIKHSQEDYVCGGIFQVNDAHRAALDCWEGHPNSYSRTNITASDLNGDLYETFTYLRLDEKEVGTPAKEYRDIVLQGAHDCGLSDEYIQKYI